MAKYNTLAFSFLILLLICCSKKETATHGVNIVEESELLAIYERDGYDEVFIVNPSGQETGHYVLLDRNDTTTYDLPQDAVEIRVPVERLIIDSEVYSSAFEELNAEDLIKGMFDTRYATSPIIKERLANGKIQDVGQPFSPNSEKILRIRPDALIMGYFDGMESQGLEKMRIPVVKMFDLQESLPLGRAEWIRLLGRLAGKGEIADSIFRSVSDRYKEIKKNNQHLAPENRPKVLTEIIYQGSWSVPGGKSYQAALIDNAGGEYFKKEDQHPVTLNLSPEQVLAEGVGADVWLIRYFGGEKELTELLKSNPLYHEIKAYKDGNIYFSDTSSSGMFREFPFHPEYLLSDYTKMFQGDTLNLKYFTKLNY